MRRLRQANVLESSMFTDYSFAFAALVYTSMRAYILVSTRIISCLTKRTFIQTALSSMIAW